MTTESSRSQLDDSLSPDDSGDTQIMSRRDSGIHRPDTMIGRTLGGRFTVRSRLGAGSMGTVYRASQDAMAREVAIKILRPERAFDEQAKARFLREARTTSLLTSPHTVTVFDFGESDRNELYLAMELLEGESLGQRLTREHRLPAAAAVDITRQALRSLGEAHGKGIVHRDLKPDNLFFAKVHAHDGEAAEIVKVVDFGIAKMLRAENQALNAVETQAGTVFGTPRYMSPEQAQGKPLDARSDLYSLGVILYHMLAGAPPFTDDDAILVMARHIKTEPRPFTKVCPDVAIPPALEQVVLRALSKDPAQRPDSAESFSQELLRALDRAPLTSAAPAPVATTPPPRAPRRLLWASVVLLAAAGVGLGVWQSRRHVASVAEPDVSTTHGTAAPPPLTSAPTEEPPHAGGVFGDEAPSAVDPGQLPAAQDPDVEPSSGNGRRKPRGEKKPTSEGTSKPETPHPTGGYGIFND